jgi:hypothetical protein
MATTVKQTIGEIDVVAFTKAVSLPYRHLRSRRRVLHSVYSPGPFVGRVSFCRGARHIPPARKH